MSAPGRGGASTEVGIARYLFPFRSTGPPPIPETPAMALSSFVVRHCGAPAIVALCLVAALAACSSDGGGPTPPDDSIVPAAIQAQIDALFPSGNLNDSATTQVEDV